MKSNPYHAQLPALDSIGYRTMVWQQQEREACGRLIEWERRRRTTAYYLRILAAALAFLHDGTILRGMQLELD